jgi:hypothetical protein
MFISTALKSRYIGAEAQMGVQLPLSFFQWYFCVSPKEIEIKAKLQF